MISIIKKYYGAKIMMKESIILISKYIFFLDLFIKQKCFREYESPYETE